MLKEERHQEILDLLEKESFIRITDLTQKLQVTEMTVRRDLMHLEKRGLLVRLHGGAKSMNAVNKNLSTEQKLLINTDQKRHIGEVAASLINDQDTVFIGPGTTTEFIYDFIKVTKAKIVTNSFNVFNRFSKDSRFEVILIGGKFTPRTKSFTGVLANYSLSKIHLDKAFVGASGIYNNSIMLGCEEEGECLKYALMNASQKYVLCDSTKLEKPSFYEFFLTEDVDIIISDNLINPEVQSRLEKVTRVKVNL